MIKKILLIDDSPVSRKILKKCIPSCREFEFYEAGNGKEGLEQLAKVKPDVIFLDLTMPVMDGREFLKEVKKKPGKAIVIVCTADVQIKSITEVMDLGAFHVIRKPPSKETVEKALLMVEEKLKSGG